MAIRLRDVTKVRRDTSFASRFAPTRPDWPARAPDVLDLDSTKGLLESMSEISAMIGIEQERRHHSAMMWIGIVDEVRTG